MNYPGQSLDGFIEARQQANDLLREFGKITSEEKGLQLSEALVLQTAHNLQSKAAPIIGGTVLSYAYPNITENNVYRALKKFEVQLGIFTSGCEYNGYTRPETHFGKPRIYKPTEFGHLVLMCFEPEIVAADNLVHFGNPAQSN